MPLLPCSLALLVLSQILRVLTAPPCRFLFSPSPLPIFAQTMIILLLPSQVFFFKGPQNKKILDFFGCFSASISFKN